MTLYPDIANLVLARGARFENRLLQLTFGAVFALVIFILTDTYRRIAAADRERLRWVLAGICVGLCTFYVGSTLFYSGLIPLDPPRWFINVLVALNVLTPMTVAYAVVRHRVLDIDFVIRRALIFAALTTLLAAVFGMLDWFFGHVLEDFRLSHVVQAAISISLGFAFERLHRNTVGVVEAIFYRKRRAARERIDRLSKELPQARSPDIIDAAVVGEAAAALELTSAAVFRTNGERGFARTAAAGWDDARCTAIGENELLLLTLRAQQASVNLADVPLRAEGTPAGARAPVIAVPLYSRGDLAGLVLYGAHRDGAAIDPPEKEQLERLGHAAALALDEIAAEQLRAQSAHQAATIDELTARLDELRRLRATALDGAAARELPFSR